MQPVTFQYSDGKRVTYQVPTAFTELAPAQFVGAIAAMHEAEQKPEAQWKLLPLVMGIPVKELDALNYAQRVQLLAELHFLYDPDKLPFECIIPRFTMAEYREESFFGKIKQVFRDFSTTLYGPGDGLKHLTFGEFMHAEQRYEQYQHRADAGALNELCGILYRRTKGRQDYEDPRLAFDENLIPYYARYFEMVRPELKEAILLNYHGAKAQFPRIYRHVFPPAMQQSEAGRAKQSQALTWLNTAVQLAQRDVTKIRDIQSSKLHLVLKVLDDTIKHNDELKSEYERIRSRR